MQRQPSQKTEDIGASLLEPSLYALVLRHDPILAIELRAKKAALSRRFQVQVSRSTSQTRLALYRATSLVHARSASSLL
jgi:hypothetical protein